jgi:hypothetical protein
MVACWTLESLQGSEDKEKRKCNRFATSRLDAPTAGKKDGGHRRSEGQEAIRYRVRGRFLERASEDSDCSFSLVKIKKSGRTW